MSVEWLGGSAPDGGETLALGSPPAARDRSVRRRTSFWLVPAVGLAAVGGFALGWAAHPRAYRASAVRLVSVRVAVNAYSSFAPTGTASTCLPQAPFDDVHAGVPVVVVAATGQVTGARLSQGHVVADACVFSFTASVPASAEWYVVQVGSHQSSSLTPTQLATSVVRFA